MNTKEHKQYLREFKAYGREILSSRDKAQQFLVRSGINSKSGKLSKNYTLPDSSTKK
jgi:hypothetical protein